MADVPCQFCGQTIHVEWTKQSPPPTGVPRTTIYVNPAASRALVLGIVAAAVVPILGGAAATVIGVVARTSARNAVALGVGAGGEVAFPFTCAPNQQVEIVGKTFEGTGTLIEAGALCKITIRDSKLKGGVVLNGSSSVELTLENSTLEGTASAVRLGTNGHLVARGQSVVKGAEHGVEGEVNVTIELDGARIEGGQSGIQAGSNLAVRGTGATIEGKDHAVTAGVNPKINGKRLTLRGGRTAIDANHNLALDAADSSIDGGEAAIRAKSNPKLKLTAGTKVTARENAIDAGNNLEIDAEGATIDGGDIGVRAESNAKLRLNAKSRVHGKKVALQASHNLELTLRDSTIESEGAGVCGAFNAEITGKGGTIRGREALRLPRAPRSLELDGTTIVGARNTRASGCVGGK